MKTESIEVLESASEYLRIISKALPAIISGYREQDIVDVSEQMILLSDGLRWLYDVAKLTKDYHSLDEDEMLGCYAELVDAMQMKDYLLLADLMEYELLPLIDNWKAILTDSVNKLVSN